MLESMTPREMVEEVGRVGGRGEGGWRERWGYTLQGRGGDGEEGRWRGLGEEEVKVLIHEKEADLVLAAELGRLSTWPSP